LTADPAALVQDFDEVRDMTVIGAGPVGMCTAFWAGMREASARVIDSLPELGGQLTTLYPEKWIFDVPGHPKVLARDLVELLRVQALIVAGGHGAFEPKKLPGYDMTPWEGRGALYIVGSKAVFEGKRVMIVGGGDSAMDWVVNLLGVADSVTLVHRREAFRAHELTIGQVLEAAERGDVAIHVPFQIREVSGNGHVERVRLFNSEDEAHEIEVEVDAILLQLGFKTALGALKDWGFEIVKGAIVADQLMKTSLERVWACGDITTFDGKLKLIATGFAESAIAVAQAVHEIRPEVRIQPAYSTNTGVPGVVAGQP
jgi:ferredoxin/flavodoxin---NADP+ reductase